MSKGNPSFFFQAPPGFCKFCAADPPPPGSVVFQHRPLCRMNPKRRRVLADRHEGYKRLAKHAAPKKAQSCTKTESRKEAGP